jgi:signal transduction histidine kinase
MMRCFTILFLLLFFQENNAQTRTIDSLRQLVQTTGDPSKKITAIGELNEQALNADTLLPYIVLAEKLTENSNDKSTKAKVAYYRASYYARKNHIDSGMAIVNEMIAGFRDNKKEQKVYLQFLFLRAKLYDRANNYSKALIELYGVIETAAETGDTVTLVHAKTGIGWVLIEMEQYKEALKWLYAASHTSADKRYYKNYGALYSNMAAAHHGLGNKDSAIFYVNRAITDARLNENLLFLATALSMQAKIFVDNGMSPMAEAPLKEVLDIRQSLDDPFYVVFDMSTLASYYASNNQPQKGIPLCKQGITMAKQLGLPSQLMMAYKALADNYKAAGEEEAYGRTLEDIIALKDSFNNINSAKMLAEMQAADENRKTEKTIALQKLNLTRKNYILYGSALFAVMAGLIAWLAFKNYKRKQRLKMELAIEKEKILGAQAAKDAGEQERKRIAADLHDNLGAQANAILYSAELLQQEKNESGVLVTDLHHTAKDMLTSLRETLWVLKNKDVTAADIWLRIINFSKQMNRHYPELHLTTEGLAPENLPFSSASALNIVFIIQEAVNNAIRHASAETVSVISEFSGKQWNIEVRDDGKGFDIDAAIKKQESYGLNNMNQRALSAGFVLEIDTNITSGTSISLIVPVLSNPKGVLERE